MRNQGFFVGAVVLIFSVLANASSLERAWLDGLRLELNGKDCHGVYEAALSGPRDQPALMLKIIQGEDCGKVSLVTSPEKQGTFAFEIIYEGDSPLQAEKGIVLVLKPPQANAVTGARVQMQFWTEPFWRNSIRRIPEETQYLLWRYPDGQYGAMIPLVGGGMRAMIQTRGADLVVISQSYDSTFVPKNVPICMIGRGSDPYKLTEDLYENAMQIMGTSGRLRKDKDFPEIFKYLGWCSWNAHYRDITHDKILEHAVSFEKAGIPVRWMLVDDGWQSVDNPRSRLNIKSTIYLTDFEADPMRFPGGLKALVKDIESHGITWVGVWHTFQGYWDGVAIDSQLGRNYSDNLFAYDETGAIPDPEDGRGERFYRDYYKLLSDSGIDFVKVDNQSTMSRLIRDRIPITEAMAGQQQNLQNAAEQYFGNNVINCMEMNIDVVYHWGKTNIGRSSGDYVPALYNNPRAHVLRNVMNAMWFSKLSYPDYDMFMTHDQHSDMHLLARAISGGPVYCTDKTGEEKFNLLQPLILSDGRILRVDEPALPTRDSLFSSDPRKSPVPLKAFAKVGKTGILAAWNVNYLFLPVRGDFSPEDIEGIKGQRFAVYDYFSGDMELMNRTDRRELRLPSWGIDLKMIVPIDDGIALFGLVDKYISPRAVKNVKQEPGRLKLDLEEGGIFGAYVESRPARIRVNGQDLASSKVSYENNFLKLDLCQFREKPVTLEWER